MTRGELVAIGAVRGAIIGFAAAVLAVVTATLLSPLMPIGIARTAELEPGISFDWLVLALGFVGTLALVFTLEYLASWRVDEPTRRRGAPKRAEDPHRDRLTRPAHCLRRRALRGRPG